jgi:hypothetical protein
MVRTMEEIATTLNSTVPGSGISLLSALSDERLVSLNQTCAALGAISRQHGGADAATRHRILGAMTTLDGVVPILCTASCRMIVELCSSSNPRGAGRYAGSLAGSFHSMSHVLSLLIGLNQTFGMFLLLYEGLFKRCI